MTMSMVYNQIFSIKPLNKAFFSNLVTRTLCLQSKLMAYIKLCVYSWCVEGMKHMCIAILFCLHLHIFTKLVAYHASGVLNV